MKKAVITMVALVGLFASPVATADTSLGPTKKIKAMNSAAFVCPKAAKGVYANKDSGSKAASTSDSLKEWKASVAR